MGGLRKPSGGRLSVAGQSVRLGSVPEALAAGIGCVPQDRQKEGIVPLLSVGENVTLPVADRLGRFGAINDQCGWYSAPVAIQRFSNSFCAAVNVLFTDFGGIRCTGLCSPGQLNTTVALSRTT